MNSALPPDPVKPVGGEQDRSIGLPLQKMAAALVLLGNFRKSRRRPEVVKIAIGGNRVAQEAASKSSDGARRVSPPKRIPNGGSRQRPRRGAHRAPRLPIKQCENPWGRRSNSEAVQSIESAEAMPAKEARVPSNGLQVPTGSRFATKLIGFTTSSLR